MPKFPDPENNRHDKITFIIDHRFGKDYGLIKRMGPLLRPAHGQKPADTTDAAAAEARLVAMADPELESEYQAVRAEIAAAKEVRAKLEAAERERQEAALPMNRKPDLSYWAKAPFWSIEEAVALVLGRDPKHASRKGVAPFLNVSPFAQLYEQTLVLAKRAVAMGQLTDGTLPGAFLAWAKRYDIPVAAELEALVKQYGQFIGDWKTLHDRVASQRDAALERERKLNEIIRATTGQVEELKRQMDSTVTQLSAMPKPSKEPDLREIDTLRRLCIGLAIGGYSYDPEERRSSVVPEIVGDLARLGLTVSDDTVRKHLRAGLSMLPQEWKEGWRKGKS